MAGLNHGLSWAGGGVLAERAIDILLARESENIHKTSTVLPKFAPRF
jgi:hypothetical protein